MKGFREGLASLQARSRSRRTNRRNARRTQFLDDPSNQRCLRTDHTEIDLFAKTKIDNPPMIGRAHGDVFRNRRRPGISGRARQSGEIGTADKRGAQCMFAAAASYYEDVHIRGGWYDLKQ